jgi:hypothetical protein
LGKVTLPAGARQRVKVQEEPWTADFTYLVRPSLSSKVFVRAFVNFPEAREIPSGQAIFMMDGAILESVILPLPGGRGAFSSARIRWYP